MNRIFAFVLFVSCTWSATAADKLKLLIVDGQNNHAWAKTTPVMQRWLTESGRFTVDVATSPAKGFQRPS